MPVPKGKNITVTKKAQDVLQLNLNLSDGSDFENFFNFENSGDSEEDNANNSGEFMFHLQKCVSLGIEYLPFSS
jgi:hypothetical protein